MSTVALSFDSSGPVYLGASRGDVDRSTDVTLFGVGYDGTTSFRPGTRFGPDAIRMASVGLELYSPELDVDLEDGFGFGDLGNVEVPFGAPRPVIDRAQAAAAHVLARGSRPLMLGGEHSLTPGPVRAVAARHPDLIVVQFDAHADLRPDYLGDPDNHACAMRRVLDTVPSDRLCQVGIRSGTRAEFVELRESGRLVAPTGIALATWLARFAADAPLYLTVDLDVFDPASLPGTGTPEPGGIGWADFAGLCAALRGRNLVAADVVELAPGLDPTGVSSVLAAKVVREICALVALSSG